MAVTRPTAEQLDIQSIAAAIAADSVAIGSISTQLTTDGNVTVTESQISDFDDYVNFTSAQTISGNKTYSGTLSTFTQDVIIQGDTTIQGTLTTQSSNDVNIGDSIITLQSELTGAPALNAGIQIERGTSTNAQILWDEATDEWKVGIVGALEAITTSAHVHDTADITTGTFNNARISSANVTQHEGDLTITESQISDLGSYATTGTLGAYFLKAGGTITGNTTLASATPVFILQTNAASQSANLQFRNESNVVEGDLYVESGAQRRVVLRKRTGGTVDSQLVMETGQITVNSELRGINATNTDGLVTLSQLNGKFNTTGGTITGNTTISTSGTPVLQTTSTAATGTALHRMSNGGGTVLELYGLDNRALLRRPSTNGGNSDLNMYDTYSIFNKEVRGVDSSTSTSFTTRGYVDGAFVALTGNQTVAGVKTFSDDVTVSNTNPICTLNGGSGGTGILDFRVSNVRNGIMFSSSGSTGVRHYATNGATIESEMALNATAIVFNISGSQHSFFTISSTTNKTTMRAPSGSSGVAEIELQQNAGARAARISSAPNMTASYTIRLPTDFPSVGDVLRVTSTSGQFVNMSWQPN